MGGGGGRGWCRRPWPPHFNFQTKKGSIMSVSNIRNILFYGCSSWTRNFTIFTLYATIFGQFMAAFHFFLLQKGNRPLHVGPSQKILNPGPSEKFLIVDDPKEDNIKREFKNLIIGRILDLLEKSFKTRESSSNKWSPTLSVLDLRGPLARTEKQAHVIKTGPTEKFL